MKTNLFLRRVLWLMMPLLTVLTVNVSQANAALRSDYTLVTEANQITAGGTYIIAYNSGAASTHTSVVPMRSEGSAVVGGDSNAYIYSGTTAGSSGTGTISMENSTLDLSAYEVTIVAGASASSFAIQLQNGNYIGFYGTSNNNVALYSSVVLRCSFTVSESGTDKFLFRNENSNSRYFKYNTSGRFSNYASSSGSTGPVVIYKKVAAVTYSVTYNANNATSGSVPTDATAYNSGATVTVKGNTGSLARTGYTFGGWNTKEDGSGTNYAAGTGTFTITANTTLYAKWTPIEYTVTWKVNNTTYTTGTPSTSVNHGSHVSTLPTAPDPASYCGDVFVGWTDEEYSGNSAPTPLYKTASEFPNATGNQTFYAVFADYAN